MTWLRVLSGAGAAIARTVASCLTGAWLRDAGMRLPRTQRKILRMLGRHAEKSCRPMRIEQVRSTLALTIPALDLEIIELEMRGCVLISSKVGEPDVRVSPRDPDPRYVAITDLGKLALKKKRHLRAPRAS